MRSRPSRILLLLVSGAMVFNAGTISLAAEAPTPAASAPQQSGKVYSQQELDELLAPIALHPDALLAQILMASTYPLDIVEAARWRKANPKVEGSALEDAMTKQPWDPSVKSLTAFPGVLDMMSEKLEWTQKLGDAFLGQQKPVMDTVQRLRTKAKAAGALSSSKEQTVTTKTEGATTVIQVEQANPQVVYVPTYNPAVVYGTWWYPSPPPYYYYPPGYVAGAAFFSFAVGVAAGSWLWGGCNWGHSDVNINVNRYNQINHFDKTNINNIQNSSWKHNTERRRGVPYQSEGAQRQFGNTQARNARTRDDFRGHAEAGRQDLGQHFDRGGDNRLDANNRGGLDRGGDNRAANLDRNRASGTDRGASGNRAGNFDRGGGAQTRTAGSERGAALSGVSSGARANDFSSRGSASRAGMRSGGGHMGGGGRRR